MTRTEIRLAGSGGQGLILGARILFRALGIEGRRAAQSQSYEPTSRGGFCYSDLIVTDDPSDYPLVTGIDIGVLLDQVGAERSLPFLKKGAIVICDERTVQPIPAGHGREIRIPISARAVAIGSPRVANIVALGAVARATGICSLKSLEKAVALETPKKFAQLNLNAAKEGFALAEAAHPSAA